MRYSVGHMGVSVLSGALTSLGASLLLFFCTLQFFSSFGTFFFGTIFLAWLWANFFFIPILGDARQPSYDVFGLIWLQNIYFDWKSLITQNCQSQISPTAS